MSATTASRPRTSTGRARRQRLASLLRTEVRLLGRFGAVAATAGATALWAGILTVAPSTRAVLVPIVLLTDVTALGFLFVPTLLLLERVEGVEAALRLTPVRTAERVAARLAALVSLSVAAGAAVVVVAGVPAPGVRLLGVTLLATLFGLAAFAATAGAPTIGDVLVRAPLLMIPLLLPALLHLIGATSSPLVHLSPVSSAVDLLRGAPTAGGVAWQLLWIGALAAAVVARAARPVPPAARADGAHADGTRRDTDAPVGAQPHHLGTFQVRRAIRSFVHADRRTVLGDGVLVLLLASVPLLTLAMRMVGSLGLAWTQRRWGIDLAPHLPVIEALVLVVHTPVVLGSVTGLLLLEDRDAGLLGPLAVTRAGLRTLLGYRLGATALVTTGALALCLPLDGVARPAGASGTVATAVAAGAVSAVPALLMAATASNRVQGVAVMKLLGLPLYLPLATWVIVGPLRWAFAPLPTSWLAWASWAPTPAAAWGAAGGAVAVSALVAGILVPRVLRRI